MLRALLDRFAPSAERRRLLAETTFVVLDTELTGLDPERDAIISIGAIRLEGPRILLGETFSELVDPGRSLEAGNVLIHRLTPDRLAGRPTLKDVAPALHAFCADAVLVGHCVRIDVTFLRRALPAAQQLAPPCVIDTAATARWLALRAERFLGGPRVPEGGGGDLFALARSLGVPVTHPHDALHDAYVTAQVWQRQLRLLADHGIERLKDLPAGVCVRE